MELFVTEIFQKGILKFLFSNKALYFIFGISKLSHFCGTKYTAQNFGKWNFSFSERKGVRPIFR